MRRTLPAPQLPEVAFLGRSNVGKSSVINSRWAEDCEDKFDPGAHAKHQFLRSTLARKTRARVGFHRFARIWIREDFQTDFARVAEVYRAIFAGTVQSGVVSGACGRECANARERSADDRLSARDRSQLCGRRNQERQAVWKPVAQSDLKHSVRPIQKQRLSPIQPRAEKGVKNYGARSASQQNPELLKHSPDSELPSHIGKRSISLTPTKLRFVVK